MYHTRFFCPPTQAALSLLPHPWLTVVEGGGFEPPKLARQIYSLIPLATREPLPKKEGDILLMRPPDVNVFIEKNAKDDTGRTTNNI